MYYFYKSSCIPLLRLGCTNSTLLESTVTDTCCSNTHLLVFLLSQNCYLTQWPTSTASTVPLLFFSLFFKATNYQAVYFIEIQTTKIRTHIHWSSSYTVNETKKKRITSLINHNFVPKKHTYFPVSNQGKRLTFVRKKN